jgi:hypothetical protein
MPPITNPPQEIQHSWQVAAHRAAMSLPDQTNKGLSPFIRFIWEKMKSYALTFSLSYFFLASSSQSQTPSFTATRQTTQPCQQSQLPHVTKHGPTGYDTPVQPKPIIICLWPIRNLPTALEKPAYAITSTRRGTTTTTRPRRCIPPDCSAIQRFCGGGGDLISATAGAPHATSDGGRIEDESSRHPYLSATRHKARGEVLNDVKTSIDRFA